MTSSRESKEKFKRITISLDVVNAKIVKNLEGIKGTSRSKVINNIIEEWVEQNADKIMNMWNIDLIGLRKIAQTSYKGIDVDKDLKELEKDLLTQLPKMFQGISSIDIEDAAKFMKVHVDSIKRIVFLHNDKLKENGLNLVYEDGKLIKENIKGK
ncbi:MAG: hypothetical protein GF311_13235 [Candidatus Lokiarchaeota archaeon]|nr:hypothetical protein [Candidatus Lokiarchaeota archaeon]